MADTMILIIVMLLAALAIRYRDKVSIWLRISGTEKEELDRSLSYHKEKVASLEKKISDTDK